RLAETQTKPAPATTARTAEADSSPEEDAPPLKGSVPLARILSGPSDYSNRTVELTDIYCIADMATQREGWVSLGLIESDLDLQMNPSGASLRVGHWKSFD